mmetsp:Transcript_13282/g.39502  ORF Transcript_13282/g.39502 Transcript_13282/m.39502 type:complete len:309 (+) Transcript_13282:625-1551(+)
MVPHVLVLEPPVAVLLHAALGDADGALGGERELLLRAVHGALEGHLREGQRHGQQLLVRRAPRQVPKRDSVHELPPGHGAAVHERLGEALQEGRVVPGPREVALELEALRVDGVVHHVRPHAALAGRGLAHAPRQAVQRQRRRHGAALHEKHVPLRRAHGVGHVVRAGEHEAPGVGRDDLAQLLLSQPVREGGHAAKLRREARAREALQAALDAVGDVLRVERAALREGCQVEHLHAAERRPLLGDGLGEARAHLGLHLLHDGLDGVYRRRQAEEVAAAALQVLEALVDVGPPLGHPRGLRERRHLPE